MMNLLRLPRLRQLGWMIFACGLVIAAPPPYTPTGKVWANNPTDTGAFIETLTGFSSEQITDIYAVEEVPNIVFVGVSIPTPIVTGRSEFYLLVRDSMSQQWQRFDVTGQQWADEISPQLDLFGLDEIRERQGTASNLTANQQAQLLVASSGVDARVVANILMLGLNSAGQVATPQAPVIITDSNVSSPDESDRIGSTNGAFRIDESGSANYSINIATAAGTAGVTPEIALGYSSSNGNGIAGLGWSLSASQSISRCRKSASQDVEPTSITWTNADALCLNGGRLLRVSGTYGQSGSTYRTEVDSGRIVRIEAVSNGEPDFFSVAAKDGSTSYFGRAPGNTDTAAKLRNSSATPKTLTWALRKIEDSVGNPIWFNYETTNGAQQLSSIGYAYGRSENINGGYGARVEFEYENRDDKSTAFVGGSAFVSDKRLKKIVSSSVDSNNDLGVVREYHLAYVDAGAVSTDVLSRLASITECVGAVCLQPTVFNWRLPESGTFIRYANSFTMANGDNKVLDNQLADINGDGRSDLVWIEANYDGNNLDPVLNYALARTDGTGFAQTAFTNGAPEVLLARVSSNLRQRLAIFDYNLDGRSDVAMYDQSVNRWKVFLAEPQDNGLWQLKNTPITTPLMRLDTSFADINSDGAVDAIYKTGVNGSALTIRNLIRDTSQNVSSQRYYKFGPEKSTQGVGPGKVRSVSADFNGDGRTDVLVAGRIYEPDCGRGCGGFYMNFMNAYVFTGDPNAATQSLALYHTFENGIPGSNVYQVLQDRIQVLDANGDGLSDLFYPVGNSQNDPVAHHLRINRGDGTFDTITIGDSNLGQEGNSSSGSVDGAQFVDWNADGYPDILWKEMEGPSASVVARIYDPATASYLPQQYVTWALDDEKESIFFPDVNGDGIADIAKIDSRSNTGIVKIGVRTTGAITDPAFYAVNRIESFDNGMGAITNVEYEAMGHSSHYERLSIPTTTETSIFCEPEFGQSLCFEQPYQAVNLGSFYSQLNAEWDLPSGTQTLGKDRPVLEMAGPTYVATSITSDIPTAGAQPGQVTSATAQVDYYYAEAKLQAAGRGFLGFQRVKSVDVQTGMSTTTTYRQDWPFRGQPLKTMTHTGSGNLLSAATNDWEILDWASDMPVTARAQGTTQLGVLRVAMTGSTERSYALKDNGTTQGSLLSTAVSSFVHDAETNVLSIVSETFAGSSNLVERTTTTNTYFNASTLPLFQGRLRRAEVAMMRAGAPAPPPRITEFQYYPFGPHKGMLLAETVMPGQAQYQLTRTHTYDEFGNLVRVAVADQNQTRCNKDTEKFDARGRYSTVSYDCFGRKTAEIVAFNKFGSATETRGFVGTNASQYVTAKSYYGALGALYLTTNDTGGFENSYATWNVANCPVGTVYKTTTEAAGGSRAEQCIDVVGRKTRSLSRGFDGQWDASDTEYDLLGRTVRQSEPYDLPQGPQYWTSSEYDVLARPIRTVFPDSSQGTISYGDLTITIKDDAQHRRIEKRNVLGEVIETLDHKNGKTTFAYDHDGALLRMTDNAGNVATTTYDDLGRKTGINAPDAGIYTYQYNAFGDMVWQIDAKGQTRTIGFDTIGRKASRIDKNAAGTTVGHAVWTYDSSPNGLGKLGSMRDLTSGYEQNYFYDALGRASTVETRIDGELFRAKTTYDHFGRVFQEFDAGGDGSFTDHGVMFTYNQYGYQEQTANALLVNGASRDIYTTVEAVNARGQANSVRLGNGLTTLSGFDPATGRLTSIYTSGLANPGVQDLEYSWDTLGNLRWRKEHSGSKNLEETFEYDTLNRLTQQLVTGEMPVDITYDDQHLGNIKTKSDVGSYAYGAGNAGPHAVTNAGGVTYVYDLNGNNTSSTDGRVTEYTTFNKPSSITKAGTTTEFEYGPERSRYKRVDHVGGTATTTLYLGNVEIIQRPSGEREKKRYLPGGLVQTVYLGYDSTPDYSQDRYVHRDHLGSTDVITNANGEIVQEQSFDAWGQRRDASDWSALGTRSLTAFDTDTTTRGYTGHEMLDGVGVIHMNGRTYDPRIGRFMQVDPYVQSPRNSQSLNRYSYVMNNPLNATDPSGHIVVLITLAIKYAIIKNLAKVPVLNSLVQAAGCWAAGPACPLFLAQFNAIQTYAVTGSGTAALKSLAISGVSAVAFGVAAKFGAAESWLRAAAHGVAGGVVNVLRGGKFGHGFVAAALTKKIDINRLIPGIEPGKATARLVASYIVGGTISAVTGGKFANGAMSGAFAQAFNGESFWRKAKRLGKQAVSVGKEFLPGYGIYNCYNNGCSKLEWAQVILEEAPHGKLLKVAKRVRKMSSGGRATRALNEITDKYATKIFGKRSGHLPDTPENRKRLSGLANDPKTTLGPDKHGNEWSGQILEDGTQLWTQTRNGKVINGGLNLVPRKYNPETGLLRKERPNWK